MEILPQPNFFNTSAICDKFHVCTTYQENTTHRYIFRNFVGKTSWWLGLLIKSKWRETSFVNVKSCHKHMLFGTFAVPNSNYQTSYLSLLLHKCTFGLNFSPHESTENIAKFPKISQNFPNFPKISPHDNFFSENIIRDIRDKYQLCCRSIP